LFGDQPDLSEKGRRAAFAYLDDSYAIIDDPRQRERRFLAQCRGVRTA